MTEKPTILHIAPSLSVMGGISTVLRNLRGTGLAQKHNLRFVASHVDGSKPKKLLAALLGLLQTLAVLLCQRIDIVHIHCGDFPSPIRKYFFYRLVRLFSPKVVLHLHGALFLEQHQRLSPAWKRRMKDFFETADLVLCLSQSWAGAASALFPAARLVVLPNGIPLPALANPELPPRPLEAPVRLTFLGLIGPRKGAFDLLDAFTLLRAQGVNAQLALGGNGEVPRLLRELAPLGGAARYLGWITGQAKEQLLRETDIFVLPSYGEGMPMSVLEAMSYGIPIVSTPVGGIPELLSEGQSGFMVPPGDTGQLAERLARLAADPGLRRRMGVQARRCVELRHDVEKMAASLAKIYGQLAAPRP